MAVFADCNACMFGDHSRHVEHWGKRPEGVIDGEFCHCTGDCAERSKAAFDRLWGAIFPTTARDNDTTDEGTR